MSRPSKFTSIRTTSGVRAVSDALRQSEDRARLMIEAVRDYAIFMLDPDGRVASWNKGAERLKGYTADEIRGQHFSVFYTDADRAREHPQEELAHALASGAYSEEGWRVRKDGTRFWASVVITALRDEQGRLYGFGKVTRDLTDHKKAEDDARRLAEAEAARETAQKIHKVTTAFAAAVTSADVTRAVFESVLPALGADAGSVAIRIPGTDQLRLAWAHGYSREALQGYQQFSIAERLPHSDAAREQRAIFFESRTDFDRAYPHMRDATTIEGLVSAPLLIGGNCIGVIGATWRVPVTLGQAERSLMLALADQCALALDRALLFENEVAAKSRAKFLAEATTLLTQSLEHDEVLQDLVKLAVPALGDFCAIEMVDGDSTRLAAVAHSDPAKVAMARNLRERFPPKPDRQVGVLQVIRSGEPLLLVRISDELLAASASSAEELRLQRELGLGSAIIVPLIARERPIGAMTLVRTQDGRPYSEADLAFVSDLGRRAALAVENARLYQELQKAVRVRDDFMSIAGHEVRTPLAAMQLYLQTMARSLAKDPVLQGNTRLRERLQKALDNGQRLERLVNEVLDVSRITAGRLSLEPEELELSELVDDVLATLPEQAARSGSELRFVRRAELRGTWDRVRTEQVVSNLLTNALKYGMGKPVEVETALEGRFAAVKVRDFGIGIESDNQARIFERFERAVSDRHYGGLGLGLWIARQVVEASGGSISVQSSPGQGSLFSVKLPIAVQDEQT